MGIGDPHSFDRDTSPRYVMNRIRGYITLAVTFLPSVAFAQSTPKTFAGLANQVVRLLGSATTDLIVLAIVVYFWGVSKSLFSQGEAGREKLREQLLWGVFVIFLAVSIWGVVQLLQSSVFGSNTGYGGGGSTAGTCTSLNGCQFGK